MADTSTLATRTRGFPPILPAETERDASAVVGHLSSGCTQIHPKRAVCTKDLGVLLAESKCVFVCERAACVLVMGLHAVSAPLAQLLL